MVLRLTERAAQQLGVGTRVKDHTPRKTRIPKPDFGAGLDTQCKQQGLPVGEPEFLFHETRKWRYDRVWRAERLVVDIDGGAWLHMHNQTAHSHGQGKNFERDRKKDAEALVRGWTVLRVTHKMIRSGEAVAYVGILLTRKHVNSTST
jgi:hypothetical protein